MVVESAAGFRRMSQLQWKATLALSLAVAWLTIGSAVEVRFDGFPLNYALGLVFGIPAVVYTYRRFDPRVSALCDTLALLAIFIQLAGMASYLAAIFGAGADFWDDRLLATDRGLGFDWLAYLKLMAAHPAWARILNLAYVSILWQALVLVAVLGFTGRYRRLQTFTLAFQIGSLACIASSALMPALGAYAYLGISMAKDHPGIVLATMDTYVATLMQLRGATPHLSTGVIEGIVTFPSMHMTLAVLFAWGFWGVPWLRWGALALNGLMVFSIPLSGSHYLVDIAGGALVAVVALAVARWGARRLYAPAAGVATIPAGVSAAPA